MVIEFQVELDLEDVKADDWVGATPLGICCGQYPLLEIRSRSIADLEHVTGLEYLPDSHSILVALSAGSFHLITLHPKPAFVVDREDDDVPPPSLTANGRNCFVQSIVANRKKAMKVGTGAARNIAPAISSSVSKAQGMRMLGMAEVAGAIGWFFS